MLSEVMNVLEKAELFFRRIADNGDESPEVADAISSGELSDAIAESGKQQTFAGVDESVAEDFMDLYEEGRVEPNPEGRFTKGTDFDSPRGEPEWRQELSNDQFAIPERRAWPIQDVKHAKVAIAFMYRGFGDAKEYPRVLKAIAKRYSDNDEVMKAVKAVAKKLRINL